MIGKNTFTVLMMLVLMAGLPLIAKEEPAEVMPRISDQDSILISGKLADTRSKIKVLLERDAECSELVAGLKEAENMFENLKTAADIKDPEAVKELLLVKIMAVDTKAREKIVLNKRMDLIYQVVVITGMIVIIIMITYSIYMYSKRK